MRPDIWGKHLWFSIHFIALGYPQEPSSINVRDYKIYFENFHRMIPCVFCSLGYVQHITERPLDLSDLNDKKSLFKWTVDIHNLVNKKLNKPQMSHEAAWDFYNNPGNFNVAFEYMLK